MNFPTTNHFTAEEEFRITGTLCPSKIVKILDQNALAQDVIDVDANIQEAMGSFPEEDFMKPVVDKLRSMIRNSNGNNREQLIQLAEIVDSVSQEVFNSADYGRQELRMALTSIKRAKQK
jgi:hypothetical protein